MRPSKAGCGTSGFSRGSRTVAEPLPVIPSIPAWLSEGMTIREGPLSRAYREQRRAKPDSM